MSAEPTAAKQVPGKPFKKGQSGNPAGRPKGARNKLGEAFLEAMHDDFSEHGVEAIEKVRTEKPDQYLKVIASILPKDMNLNINRYEDLSDDELIARLNQLRDIIGPLLGSAGDGRDSGGTEETTRH